MKIKATLGNHEQIRNAVRARTVDIGFARNPLSNGISVIVLEGTAVDEILSQAFPPETYGRSTYDDRGDVLNWFIVWDVKLDLITKRLEENGHTIRFTK